MPALSKDNGLVFVHADESCLGNQFSDRAAPGGAAGLIESFDAQRGWTRRDYFLSEPDSTNNRMALRSAIEGLASLKHAERVVFYSDSIYLAKGMKDWIHTWAARGWKRKGGPIENLDLWLRLVEVAARYTVEWRWIRGHAGDPKNEYANYLAVTAAKKQLTSSGLVESGFSDWIEEQQERELFIDFLDLPPDRPFRANRRPPKPPRHL